MAIDTAIQMRCQNRDYEAAVRAAAPKAEIGHSVAVSCPLGGPCREDCDRTQDGCVQIWGPAEDHAEALRRNLSESGIAARIDKTHIIEVPYAGGAAAKAELVLTSHPDADTQVYDLHLTIERPEYPKDPAASATAAPSHPIPPGCDTDPVGVVDGPPASAAPAGPPNSNADLIIEILGSHRHYMYDIGNHACACGKRFTDYVFWRDHAADAIAERIEKAAPPDAFEIANWVADAARYIGGLPGDVARLVAASVSVRLTDATTNP
ncbi:hypothetical protein HZU38_05585 [Mycolicibacterium vanbaalenii]|uniref:hypothetical protein n=1 Tax=Mycolicibacterium vanbaalenii TaxID=110539 RepID=UPI001F2A6B1D|nr:hypothetical protein [Mycolicibacterium vanbaalenii]UJL29972.1 hypothetical protein HZU38_05585 [Mycolicibacterium vanbaalenii]WND56966.1 hypothetical protein QQA43_00690 [Mycolicibacterium vanbaalenii]